MDWNIKQANADTLEKKKKDRVGYIMYEYDIMYFSYYANYIHGYCESDVHVYLHRYSITTPSFFTGFIFRVTSHTISLFIHFPFACYVLHYHVLSLWSRKIRVFAFVQNPGLIFFPEWIFVSLLSGFEFFFVLRVHIKHYLWILFML